MESMRHDLRAALDEVPPEAIQASTDALKKRRPAHQEVCWKCSSPPPREASCGTVGAAPL
jgi:hypothetical protein